jgi:hypothetical protein
VQSATGTKGVVSAGEDDGRAFLLRCLGPRNVETGGLGAISEISECYPVAPELVQVL